MNYRYEKMCIDAGCNEETTVGIRRYLDAEKKRLKRQRKVKEEEGIVFNRLSSFVNEDGDQLDFSDMSFENEESDMFHQEMLEEIRNAIDLLNDEDRELIYMIFGDERIPGTELAKKMGIPTHKVRYRKEKILQMMKNYILRNQK